MTDETVISENPIIGGLPRVKNIKLNASKEIKNVFEVTVPDQ